MLNGKIGKPSYTFDTLDVNCGFVDPAQKAYALGQMCVLVSRTWQRSEPRDSAGRPDRCDCLMRKLRNGSRTDVLIERHAEYSKFTLL